MGAALVGLLGRTGRLAAARQSPSNRRSEVVWMSDGARLEVVLDPGIPRRGQRSKEPGLTMPPPPRRCSTPCQLPGTRPRMQLRPAEPPLPPPGPGAELQRTVGGLP